MPLSNLLSDFWSDLHDISMLWQLGTIFLCVSAGWVIARGLRTVIATQDTHQRVIGLGVESFARVLWPLLSVVLIDVAKPVLARWHHINLLRVAIPLIASFALIRLAFYIVRRVFARSGQAGSFLLLFEKVFAVLVWSAVALYITGLWPDLIDFLENTIIPLGHNKQSLLTILQALVFVAVTLILALWASTLLEERLMRVETMHSSMRVVLTRMARAVFVLVGILISLSLVGIDLTVLSVFGGALGVGIGLGLQKIVSSYVSGFVILLERSLAVGDMVTVDKYYGKVTQINTRYTILRGLDGIESIVPNEMLVLNAVQNYSLTDRLLSLSTHVTVDYQTDIDDVITRLEQITAAVPRIVATPAPQALLLNFGADGLELQISFWIADPENGRSNILSEVNKAIWRMLKANRINVPYPQREIRVLNETNSHFPNGNIVPNGNND